MLKENYIELKDQDLKGNEISLKVKIKQMSAVDAEEFIYKMGILLGDNIGNVLKYF